MPSQRIILYAVSDATGDLTMNVAVAAARQFQELNPDIRRCPLVNTREKVEEMVQQAKREHALIIYTLVSAELRHLLMEEAKAQGVASVDVMGPVLESIAEKAHLRPSDQPGLQYKKATNFLKRTDSMIYTVKHDDGQTMDTVAEADIIMFGISRTSKTPLSIYLAYRGYRVANVPIVKGVELPRSVLNADRSKMVGVIIDPETLVQLRSARLQKLGRPLSEDYGRLDYIKEELAYQRQVFAKLGNIPVINITNKAIEEAATEILTVLGR